MDVALFEVKAAGSTSDTAIVATDTAGELMGSGKITFFIKVISGTFQFGVGSVHASAQEWAAGEEVYPVTCNNGELHFIAASALDTFILTTA